MTFIAIVVLAAFLIRATSKISDLEKRIGILEAGRAPVESESSHVQNWVAPSYEKKESAQTAAPDNVPAVEVEHSSSWVPPVGESPVSVSAVAEHVDAAGYTASVTLDESASELSVGGTWFTAVGALALIIAGGFFFRYAVNNGWISEALRVALAIGFGSLILAIGVRLIGVYKVYAGIVSGLGLSLVLLGVFAAGALYGMWSPLVTLLVAAAVSIFGAFLSTRISSQLLLAVTFIGAYIAPFLFEYSSLGHLSIPLYSLVVAVGITVAAYRVAWKMAAIVALIGSYTTSAIWILDGKFSGIGNEYSSLLTLLSLAGLFVAFSVVSLLHYVRHNSTFDDRDAALVVVNAFGFLGSFLIAAGDTAYAGSVTFLLGGLHAIAWWAVQGNEERASRYRYALGAVALTMFAIFIPVQFDAYAVSLLWSALAFVAAVVAARTDSSVARWFSGIIFTLAFVRLITWESTLPIGGSLVAPMLNERVFVFAANAAAMIAAAYMVRTAEKQTTALPSLLSVYGFISLFVLLNIEFASSDVLLPWFAACASALAAIAVVWGTRYTLTPVRYLGYFAHVVYGILYLYFLGETAKPLIFLVNLRTFAAATVVVSGVVSALVIRSSKNVGELEASYVPKLLAVGVNILMLWALTADVVDVVSEQQAQTLSVSFLWLGYAACAMVVGIVYRWFSVRKFAVVLLMIVVLKVFLVDSSSFDDLYRFLSYGTLGVILLVVGYAYNKYRNRIDTFIRG